MIKKETKATVIKMPKVVQGTVTIFPIQYGADGQRTMLQITNTSWAKRVKEIIIVYEF